MSKYSEIAEDIKREIKAGVYAESEKLPTEYFLVEKYGVSRQTVRQAISSLKHEGLVYQIQGSGTYVAKQSRKRERKSNSLMQITVICTYMSDYIFPSIIRGIESSLSSHGFFFNPVATGNRVDTERKILESIINDQSVDGIIVEGTKTAFPNPNIGLYCKIREMGIPVLFLHCGYPELTDAVVVGMDDKAGGKAAAQRLVKSGCKNIYGIFKSDDRQGLLRYAGFSEGIIESGLGLEHTRIMCYTTEDVERHGYFYPPEMLKEMQENGADGIVCYNDEVAFAICRAFTVAGMEIPTIVSFDRSYLASQAFAPFYSLGHRQEELGVIAAEKMVSMLSGNKETSVYLEWT